MLARCIAALVGLTMATAATAQWVPGSEITGQRVQVQTAGVTNTIQFDANGVAHISSPTGATVVDANWRADGNQLCLTTPNTSDCYPYAAPFEADRPIDLVSKCGVTSRFLALLPPGERG